MRAHYFAVFIFATIVRYASGKKVENRIRQALTSVDGGATSKLMPKSEGNLLAKMIYASHFQGFTKDLTEAQQDLLIVHIYQHKHAIKLIEEVLSYESLASSWTGWLEADSIVEHAIGKLKDTVKDEIIALVKTKIQEVAQKIEMTPANLERKLGMPGAFTDIPSKAELFAKILDQFQTREMEVCLNSGACARTNGFLDCYEWKSDAGVQMRVMQVGADDLVESSKSLVTCGAGTQCKTTEGKACPPNSAPICVSEGMTSLNKCICGVNVESTTKEPEYSLCHLDGRTTPTLGVVKTNIAPQALITPMNP